MRTYDNPDSRQYSFPNHDFGSGGSAFSIPVPTPSEGGGYSRFAVRDISVCATEGFTADTTGALVQVGTAADADAYAELNCGTTAATDSVAASGQLSALKDAEGLGPGVGSIGALTQLEVVYVAPTGGTPAGQGTVHIVVDWF